MLATVLHRTTGYTGELILGDGTVLEFVNGQAGPATITFADAQSLTVMGYSVVTADPPPPTNDPFDVKAASLVPAGHVLGDALRTTFDARYAPIGAGGGSGLTVASTVTSASTLVASKHTPVDATSGALTVTLPTGAASGTLIAAEKVDASTNAVTVTGNMRGTAGQSITLLAQFEVRLFVADSAGSWRPVADHRTKSSLDAAYALPSQAGSGGKFLATDGTAASWATPGSLVTLTQQSGLTYTLTLTDAGKDLELTNTQTETLTVPPNSSVAFPIGSTLAVRQMGVGYVNVIAGGGVTLRAPNGSRTSTQYSTVHLLKRATDEWVVSGDTSTALAPPNTPTIGTATAGQQSAVVPFTPAASGPSATSYTATSTPGAITVTGSGSPITMPGLTAGTAYTFTVHATNTGGSSAESAASNSVTPTAPPAPSIPTTNMVAWFDASQISGVADGAAVASWLDVSPGAAHPLSQASSGNQPKLRSSSAVVALPNSKPVVDFDGFTQSMVSTSHGLTSAVFTVFWVAASPAPGKTQCMCAFGSGDSIFNNTGNAWCIFCGSTLTSSALVASGTYHQLTAVYNGASSLVRQDAVQVGSGNAGTTAPDGSFGYTVGANPGGTSGWWKGQIAELIVYNSTLNGTDTTTVETYLKTKYGTP